MLVSFSSRDSYMFYMNDMYKFKVKGSTFQILLGDSYILFLWHCLSFILFIFLCLCIISFGNDVSFEAK